MRVSLGSIVVYEAACRGSEGATSRGDQLLGVVVDDLGPGAQLQYKVSSTVHLWVVAVQMQRMLEGR